MARRRTTLTESLIRGGWDDHLPQRFIREHMRSIPKRLKGRIRVIVPDVASVPFFC